MKNLLISLGHELTILNSSTITPEYFVCKCDKCNNTFKIEPERIRIWDKIIKNYSLTDYYSYYKKNPETCNELIIKGIIQ